MNELFRKHRVLLLAPLSFTLFVVVWTAVVHPLSSYGDQWAVWPVVVALPLAAAFHAYLLYIFRPKGPLFAYAALHLAVFSAIWVACLMLVSHDSL